MNRIDRISALLVQLQSRPLVKSSEMAERFGVSLRTIYRDMRTLSEAGVPVCGNPGVGYSLVEGYRLPSLMFTKEEAIAFLTAEKIIEQLTDTQNSNYFRQGMDKIRAALRAVDKRYLHEMDDTIAVYKSRSSGESLPNIMQIILSSINDKLILEVDYSNADENKSKRALEAVGISYSHPRWYLSAWCHLREEYRMFRLDRISNIRTTDNKHTKAHPPLDSLLDCVDSQCLIEVVLLTSKEVSKQFADRCYFMGLTNEKELADGRIEQTYMAYSLEGLARWVLANADTTTVIKPFEIKDIIKQIIQKLDV
ncbi:putative DNA-binding transcriptional regulator YafY [Parabacteroides sp. PF5-5]|uniref:helix-turn-helix transcriptional regulator n=1 Tax=unclassified Parabacteroides TaxID=2649774 RepID=UPI00247522CC|nr:MULTISPECIES: transcriptional regulator [unclassified Parabacteroides]MDH6305170.1 putative DNA-binding transcriptional regulator YafY [Parabacteroides sp. PH5-39]MDH6316520.1 putative DNA-binding transcriptional regulator YafY [Parabacteroides sp. PF5-13]MDH6320030.1 putative DNA-binding transcriptional regulator YafY [Parabacteroides sp. PH5-13]MDH6323737.1 putative DNA-binding transcriptional regulator YafY [Parabacteroides sp. PH5-8]MDH6327707.1 putative DNA-binding transcriptional regu